MASDGPAIQLTLSEEHLPRYDASHGTPDPLERRVISIRLPNGSATFEQTDYGHPGRFNDWAPRGIDTPLQPRTAELLSLCQAVGAILK